MYEVEGFQIGRVIADQPKTILYEAACRRSGNPILLKLWKDADRNQNKNQKYIKNEYEVLKGLFLDGVMIPVSLVDGRTARGIAFRHMNVVTLEEIIKERRGVADLLPTAASLSKRLTDLHKKRIVHANLNSRNALICRETGRVILGGFELAMMVGHAKPPVHHDDIIEGSLHYISPEQTGRVALAVDHRSDLYSLGVVLYELFTGRLPFDEPDLISLVHAHMVKEPIPLSRDGYALPGQIDRIIRKLLAKSPEARYQTAEGLTMDLEECLFQIRKSQVITGFKLDQGSISSMLELTDRLYGREREVEAVIGRYRDVREGGHHTILISGPSGVGKTSLVSETAKSMHSRGGILISGKFDQYFRNTPYHVFDMAFRELMDRLTAGDGHRKEQWQDRFRSVLGTNGRIITDVFPDMERLLGKQPPVPEISPKEAQNRFNLTVSQFIGVCCSPESPLVLFIDDMQWIDHSSLNLMAFLFKDQSLKYFMIIGAYREEEAGANPALQQVFSALAGDRGAVTEICLEPLRVSDITELFQDLFPNQLDENISLAKMLHARTNGNPYHLKQLIHDMFISDIITYEDHDGSWGYDVTHIDSLISSATVMDLVVKRIKALPEETQKILRLASCVGNTFDIRTLQYVFKTEQSEIIAALQPAIINRLVSNQDSIVNRGDMGGRGAASPSVTFSFCHDRVQQAAYALIQGRYKWEIHLKIGRLLLESLDERELEERLFEVVSHFNLASGVITDPAERLGLARLNMQAGLKAKLAVAYEQALKYFRQGQVFVEHLDTGESHGLAFGIKTNIAEMEYLNGDFEKSKEIISELFNATTSALEKAEIHRLLIIQYTLQANYREAFASGRNALALLGIVIPEERNPNIPYLISEQIKRIEQALESRSLSLDGDLSVVRDGRIRVAMEILSDMLPMAFFLELNMFAFLTGELVLLSLENGHASGSAYGFVCYGRVLITRGRYREGYEFGALAMKLSERYDNPPQTCRCHNSFANFILPWQKYLGCARDLNNDAYVAGLHSGEFQFAGYCVSNDLFNMFYQGRNLSEILELCAEYESFVIASQNKIAAASIETVRWTCNRLVNSPKHGLQYDRDALNINFQSMSDQVGNSMMVACHLHTYMAELYYLSEEPLPALRHIEKGAELFDYVIGSVITASNIYFHSLILIELHDQADGEARGAYLEKIIHNQERLREWAEACPDNFRHKYLLVEAEKSRISHDGGEGLALFDEAIGAAAGLEFTCDEALGNELAAKRCLATGNMDAASTYLEKALAAYRRWGAAGRVQYLAAKYKHLLAVDTTSDGRIHETSSERLDLLAVIKASHALTREIQIDRLLSKLTVILIENTGAQQGYIILKSGNELRVQAVVDAQADYIHILGATDIMDHPEICSPAIRHVTQSREYLAVQDAARDRRFNQVAKIRGLAPKSVLCGPIVAQNKLLGVFYLENRLIEGAFTHDRIELVKLLTAPMAISIENARLYAEKEAQAEKIRIANQQLKKEIHEKQRTEEKYRGIFENAVEGIFQAAPDGTLTNVNQSFASLLGYAAPAEMLLEPTRIESMRFVDDDLFGFIKTSLLDRYEAVSGVEAELIRRDGVTFWASINARPIFDENGEFTGIDGIIHDITDRMMKSMELQKREEFLRKENIRLRSNIRDRFKFGGIVGKSVLMQGVYDLILKSAGSDANVIVYGESGTGKELVARAIHDMSDRKSRGFITVNCGAVPENLMESEFFGYKKGAFTGAYTDKPGLLEMAEGGTLFLDELGEIPLNMQVKLLRVLEGRGYTPVGDSTIRRTNIRIIAATHRALQDRVKAGLIREDFFYRIHVIPILLPPLRKRREDIPLLIDHFKTIGSSNEDRRPIPGWVLDAMLQYDWPGNVRELQNTLQRYLMLGTLDFMGGAIRQGGAAPAGSIGIEGKPLGEAVEAFEKELISNALSENKWKKSRTAASLGIDRKTLFRKMRAYGL